MSSQDGDAAVCESTLRNCAGIRWFTYNAVLDGLKRIGKTEIVTFRGLLFFASAKSKRPSFGSNLDLRRKADRQAFQALPQCEHPPKEDYGYGVVICSLRDPLQCFGLASPSQQSLIVRECTETYVSSTRQWLREKVDPTSSKRPSISINHRPKIKQIERFSSASLAIIRRPLTYRLQPFQTLQ
ncbi:hypothetical protein J6590_059083 [Homalodisca vitripennis]|nr:hypothetical protein J6590_059083 [Homalodisca vitripennis]